METKKYHCHCHCHCHFRTSTVTPELSLHVQPVHSHYIPTTIFDLALCAILISGESTSQILYHPNTCVTIDMGCLHEGYLERNQ